MKLLLVLPLLLACRSAATEPRRALLEPSGLEEVTIVSKGLE